MILLYGIRNLFPGIPAISVIPQGHCPGLNSALFAEDACTQCWHEDFYLCKSCGGIMHLLLMEIPGHKKQEDISESEETKEFVDSSDPFCQK